MSGEKVVQLGKDPVRVRPEMLIRWLMSNMDKIEQLVVVGRMTDATPVVAVSDGASPYMMSMAAAILQDRALETLERKSEAKTGDHEEDTSA